MAIVVLDEPTKFYPIYHPSIFNLDSTLKNEINFKYNFRIIINAIEVRKINVSPAPITGNGFLDVRRHILDFLDQDIFDITDADFQEAANVEYTMKIDETWIDGAGVPQINVDAHVFDLKIGFNTRLNRNAFFGDLTKLQVDTGTPGEMLINIKPLSEIAQDDLFFIHFSGNTTPPFKPIRLEINQVNRSGGFISQTIIAAADLAHNSQLVTMDLGLIAFNALTYFIDFRLIDLDSNPVSESIRLIIKPRPCTKYTPVKFIYLDSKGSYCSLNFDGVTKENTKTKIKRFRKYINPLTENQTSRGVQRFFMDSESTFTANTFITDDFKNIMFEDLTRSNRVFIDLRNDPEFDNVDFLPIEVLETSFKPKKEENNQLAQYKMKFRFAFEEIDR